MADELTVLIQDVEAYAERVEGGLSKKLDTLIVDADDDFLIVWPYIKAGIVLLWSQVGKAAISAETAALPAIGASMATGNITAALVTAGTVAAAAITSTVNAEAGADAQTEINDAAANGVTTASLAAPLEAAVDPAVDPAPDPAAAPTVDPTQTSGS